MRKSIEELVVENYPALAIDLLAPLLDVLRVARDALDGDLEKYLILLAIAVRTVEQGEFIPEVQKRLSAGESAFVPGIGTNGRSVAESLGIPRETVRRKIKELVSGGWVVRENNLLMPTGQAYEKLALLRKAQARQAVRSHEAVERLKQSFGQ